MGRGKVFALALGALLVAAAVEAHVGSTRYVLNGAAYTVPHKYEFMRNFRLPWLEGVEGLDKEPDESVWLLIPASELARDIPGYRRIFRGYSSELEADMAVNVLGGEEALEFPQDRINELRMVADALTSGEGHEPDKAAGWERVYSMRGMERTPGEGSSLFNLMPRQGPEKLPADWRPPSCQGGPGIDGREAYDCSYIIYRNGLIFEFSLRQENLAVANRIPDYVMARLEKWQD